VPTESSSGGSTLGRGLRPSEALRLQARTALEDAGLPYDEQAHGAYLRQRLANAQAIAADVHRRLWSVVPPSADEERSLLAGVEVMAAFACTVVDWAHELLAPAAADRDNARRALTEYVIASAIFDHVCDEDRALLPEISERLSEAQLREAVASGFIAVPHDGAPLVRYFFALVSDFLSRLSTAAGPSRSPGGLRALFLDELLDTYRGQMRSTTGTRDLSGSTVWKSPLLVAYLLVDTNSVATRRPDKRLDELVEHVGAVLALVDDVADIEEDWTAGSANRLLDPYRGAAAPPSALPWTRVLDNARDTGYFREVRRRAAAFAREPWGFEVGAWLYYWLYS